jgi:hypothetical protein
MVQGLGFMTQGSGLRVRTSEFWGVRFGVLNIKGLGNRV